MNDSSHYRSIAIDPRVQNAKAVEMHVNAEHFVRDGEDLGTRATAGQFFLFVHGIELALKSFLHDRGLSLEAVWGHDLSDLLDKGQTHGLSCSQADTKSIVARLSKSVEKAKLRYVYEFEMPLLQDVRRVARGVVNDTAPALPPLK